LFQTSTKISVTPHRASLTKNECEIEKEMMKQPVALLLTSGPVQQQKPLKKGNRSNEGSQRQPEWAATLL
jgi:hypothetical protein